MCRPFGTDSSRNTNHGLKPVAKIVEPLRGNSFTRSSARGKAMGALDVEAESFHGLKPVAWSLDILCWV